MKKATDELLKTHVVVRKVLEGFAVKNKRFPEIMTTLHRTLLAHAWLQDEILLPALKEQALLQVPLLNEICQEHKDLELLVKSLFDTSLNFKSALESKVLQIRIIIETHFRKEAEILYPLVEKTVNLETLNRLGDVMSRRQTELREVVRT